VSARGGGILTRGRVQREPGVSGWPWGGLGGDHTGGGSVVDGELPSDGDGEAEGGVVDPSPDPELDDGGRLVGNPVEGLTGDVVPNGCGVRNGESVPLGDCGATVDGDDDGGSVCGVVVPV
jgi:hypothetical protein